MKRKKNLPKWDQKIQNHWINIKVFSLTFGKYNCIELCSRIKVGYFGNNSLIKKKHVSDYVFGKGKELTLHQCINNTYDTHPWLHLLACNKSFQRFSL